MIRLRTTCGLVAATLLTLAVAVRAEASNAKKDPSAQHAKPLTAAVEALQIVATQFAITMVNSAEVLYQAQAKEVVPARFEGTVADTKITANSELWIGHRGEDPPEATASPSSMLNTQTAANRNAISANFVGTNTDIGNKLTRAFAAANNPSNGAVLRL